MKLKIVEEINEDPIIEKDLEFKMAETFEDDIKRTLKTKVSRISMTSNHKIVNLKILLFWC